MHAELGYALQKAAERSTTPLRRSPTFIAGILAVTAITIMLFAPPALAATPLSISGETLDSNNGTTSAPGCQSGFISGNTGSFSVTGTATGPYPGTFVENGTFYVSGNNLGPLKSDLYVDFNATFTITVTSPLGMLPITGTLSQAGFDGGVCISGSYRLFNFPIGYTLTGNYSGAGAAGWPASGALVNADFQADTSVATVNESFAAGAAPFTPTVSTGLAINVASGSATVEGTVDDKGEVATYRFDYGTSTNYGSQTISEPVIDTGSTPTFVDAALTGLSPDTVYHYRIEATDTLGGTSYGSDQTFTTTGRTQSLPPAVTTGSASGVGSGSATIGGTVNPNGQATTYHVDYGTSTNYGSQAPAPPDPSAGSGTTAQIESTNLTGLSPNTVYHYRIEATNASGTSYGADQTFTTTGGTQSLAPAVTTGSASGVGSGSATIGGTVNPNGQATTYHVDYGASTNYGSQAPAPPDPSAGSGTTAQTESTNLTGLSPNTVYHYRIEATNASGTSYGADQTFTTANKRHR